MAGVEVVEPWKHVEVLEVCYVPYNNANNTATK